MCCPSCPVTPPAPCWHIPAWTSHYLGGGDKDTVPLHTPMAREAGAGVLVQNGVGGSSSGHSQSCPHTLCQHPHSALSPAARAKGKGWGPGSHSPQDGWVKLNPIWFHYWLQSLESWLLSSSARKGQGGGTEITGASLCPMEEVKYPPLSPPITHITGQLCRGMHHWFPASHLQGRSILRLYWVEGGWEIPLGHSWMARR